jgi:hypothetical protein
METATNTQTIPQPETVTPIEVDITTGAEYPDHLWRDVTATIDAAEAEVIKARTIKRQADAAYEAAMAQREAVQAPRDQMIATDRRTPAQVGRLAGIGRARCSQIRMAILRKTAETTAGVAE